MMNLNINYYNILEINHDTRNSDIKKSYYTLSKKYHPDKTNDNNDKFEQIAEAYSILSNIDKRSEYDKKSKYGKNYDESIELLNYEFNNNAKFFNKEKFDKFKKEEGLNLVINIDEKFDGSIIYERYIICKSCEGNGKDLSSKIKIKDLDPNSPTYGKITYFEGDHGCDFCEGTGISWNGLKCGFCNGEGKVGLINCKKCNGEKRILVKQKLSNIDFDHNNESMRIDFMGNFSKDDINISGHLFLVKEKKE